MADASPGQFSSLTRPGPRPGFRRKRLQPRPHNAPATLPYLAASSLVAVLAQRLVRRNCPNCSQPYIPTDSELRQLGATVRKGDFRKGHGCVACRQTGYRGRFGVSELLVVNDAIREHIQQRANASQILAAARGAGMKRLQDDGVEKAMRGLTTLAEVGRITVADLLEA